MMTIDDWKAECANALTAELLETNARYLAGQFQDFGWTAEIARVLQEELRRRAAATAQRSGS